MLTRRQAVAGLGAAALPFSASLTRATALPAPVGAPTRPPRLREGDVLGLVAPAGFIADRFGLAEIEETVRAMGLVPRSAPHLLAREGYLAGSDEARARDLMAMFEDDGVRAVMAVRGGWGSARLLPHLDFAAIARKPKLFTGFSDNTALHLALAARTGVHSIHGPNASASWPPQAWESFRRVAFDAAMPTYTVAAGDGPNLSGRGPALRTFRGGKARGRLLGGNLTVLSALVGTPYLPDFTGAILFLEETNESEYRIDRMLTQLALAGILDKVAGVVFGQCTRCHNPDGGYSNFTVYEVLDRQFAALGVPAFQGAMIGHIAAQVSMPVGVMAEIDADAGTIRMLEAAVA
ncbi:S66 peptidase family protein [Novosphingobium mangrovi (ex Huang et al. 2023)]|uniref:LD-carboxypeptidase n=1 Tax=Novosphingobium mangrovi (ex Huang et al. 2023) TaxID=2976432 RepID=A0ABT2I952_9SPHN|nr:LD-carboxypeptidase [Novosphingobium mangrovi (ex Huang et al. 2023)]MCT2401360.1 LD-carboxypeptidase [Novosphingobium mangrovi (ex Huang et al. 2023)]